LDGMVEVLVEEIPPPSAGSPWRDALRERILAARRVLLRHPWARQGLESRTTTTPAVLGYLDATAAVFRDGGFPDELTHHVMHALGSRIWGFSQELFQPSHGDEPSPGPGDQPDPAALAMLAERYPSLAAIALTASHEDGTVVGRGCDDQAEFEFALDLVLDSVARLRERPWRTPGATG
ncbi:MAG TPA: TetR/AcrR family transcriptional regulator C-terminal domain-containing protein, partial [Actinotalea sp.]|nr:TetR/AcrR family transcriptional regulator C-terminal domain-containing protein [Actinotalea sp.]